ncbi:MAG TPA: 6-phosphogluconolactonase, partial [Gemmatimonadaceae bacterium]|nr:6-phosphogluconolactonase [Gemmatimonadaceae bacterium]
MPVAPIRNFPSVDAGADYVAERVLSRVEAARGAGRSFRLGFPTGRSPRPVLEAMAARLARQSQSLAHVTLVLMDEYLVPGPAGLQYAPADAPWSCHWFGRVEIIERLNAVLPEAMRLSADRLWCPLPSDPPEYDRRLAAAGGIDLFLLASGANDGHVAFNPPGSARDSRTRIIPLPDGMRRDNLQSFPSFGTLENVPHHAVSSGIATIADSHEAIMLAWGSGKRET